MLNSTIHKDLPDVFVIACIEHGVSLEAFKQLEAALVKHDNNMKDYSWWLTDHTVTANHSNYLVCDRANTRSLSYQESGMTSAQLLQYPP